MNRMFVVCFDVCDDKRLRRIARELGNFGVRVQKSVFECHLDDSELAALHNNDSLDCLMKRRTMAQNITGRILRTTMTATGHRV